MRLAPTEVFDAELETFSLRDLRIVNVLLQRPSAVR